MSKAMDPADADGENVGMVRFDRPAVPTILRHMDAIVEGGSRRDWAPRAFEAFANEQPLYAIGTRGFPWSEIDFPEDYERAIRDVLPSIEPATRPSAARGLAHATSR